MMAVLSLSQHGAALINLNRLGHMWFVSDYLDTGCFLWLLLFFKGFPVGLNRELHLLKVCLPVMESL